MTASEADQATSASMCTELHRAITMSHTSQTNVMRDGSYPIPTFTRQKCTIPL